MEAGSESPYKHNRALSASHKPRKQPSHLPPRPPSGKNPDHGQNKQYESFVVGRLTKEQESKAGRSRSRPSSGSKVSGKGGSASTSSISAYMQLKNAGMLNSQGI